MEIPVKYYLGREILEYTIETTDGEWFFVEAFDHVTGLVGEVLPVYSFEECERLGLSWIDSPCAVIQYNCNLQIKVDGGFVKVINKDKLLLMIQRRFVKRIVTKIDDVEI
ncbi:MAG: hypothetical protein K6G75_05985 [Lachnospiraceae bacterium]|nr:hypothetical protein [Lachnospiraceae bacterium]